MILNEPAMTVPAAWLCSAQSPVAKQRVQNRPTTAYPGTQATLDLLAQTIATQTLLLVLRHRVRDPNSVP